MMISIVIQEKGAKTQLRKEKFQRKTTNVGYRERKTLALNRAGSETLKIVTWKNNTFQTNF